MEAKTKKKIQHSVSWNPDTENVHPPLKYVSFFSDHPCKALCASVCCLYIIPVILIVIIGFPGINMTDVPFYTIGDIYYLREDAQREARKQCKAIPTNYSSDTGITLPRSIEAYVLTVIFESTGNIFDKGNVETIAGIENHIVNAAGMNSKGDDKKFQDYCQVRYDSSGNPLGWSDKAGCRTPQTALAFLDTGYVPLPYHGGEAMWVSPAFAAQCPLAPYSEPNNTATLEPWERYLATFLPSTMLVSEFLSKWNSSQAQGFDCPQECLDDMSDCHFKSLGEEVMPSISCEIWKTCAGLLVNTILRGEFWGRSKNQMWDYGNISELYDANIANFTSYWSTYLARYYSGGGASRSASQPELTPGVQSPFVYGEVVAQGGMRNLVPQPELPLISFITDSTFGGPEGGATGKAIMSTFYFGAPLTNIDSGWTSVGEQGGNDKTDFTAWVFNTYHKYLWDKHFEQPNDLKIVWSTEDKERGGNPIVEAYSNAILQGQDGLLLIVSFVFVYFYIVFMKSSFFLASCAMGMIVLSFIPTAAIYVICQQKYIGMLHILSLFLIMGVGADDVFVLLDAYKEDRDPQRLRELRQDLSTSWRHASKAMLCTTSTTSLALLSNVIGNIPAIKSFGLWTFFLMIVNFCSVNTVYLAVTAVYDQHLARNRICCCDLFPCCDKKPLKKGDEEETQAAKKTGFLARLASFELEPFFEHQYADCMCKLRIPFVVLWLLLTIAYVVIGAQIQADPDFPKSYPSSDPYEQYAPTLIKHFAGENPKRMTVSVVFGIHADEPISTEGKDPADSQNKGDVKFLDWAGEVSSQFDRWVAAQAFLVAFCEDLESKMGNDDSLKIATRADLNGADPVICPWMKLRSWAEANNFSYPQTTAEGWWVMINSHWQAPNPTNPVQANFESWKDFMFWDDPNSLVPKYFKVNVKLDEQFDILYTDGLKLAEAWSDYIDSKRGEAPAFMREYFYAEASGIFGLFKVQETLNSECLQGIMYSLLFALAVLLVATRNIIMAIIATISIGSIVMSCFAFAVLLDWKLGIIEAVVFIMVIGLSVDYVVHLADAYLEALVQDRRGRAKFMLRSMGVSVLSGAVTTFGAAVCLSLCYTVFFNKFGLVILWAIFQSVLTALVFFTSMMFLFGPQGNFGSLMPPFLWLYRRVRGDPGTKKEAAPEPSTTEQAA